MKLAISNIAWNIENNSSVYKIMRENNFSGLEIAPTKFFPKDPYLTSKEDVMKLKNNIESEKLEVVSMQSILFGKAELVLFENEERRKELLKYLKLGVCFAKKLGIKNIVFGNPKNRISNSKNDWNIALHFFRELGEFAHQNGVVIGIEANPEIYGGNFITTTEEAINFVLECNSLGVGLNLDLGTMIQNNEGICILDKIEMKKISHIHISEPYLNLISKKNEKLHKNFFRYLKRKNYENYISIEMKFIEDNTLENIEDILKYISNLREEAGNE